MDGRFFSLNDQTVQKLAEDIAKDLFTSGSGQVATRLVMLQEPDDPLNPTRDLGGWCEEAVINRIRKHLIDDNSCQSP